MPPVWPLQLDRGANCKATSMCHFVSLNFAPQFKRTYGSICTYVCMYVIHNKANWAVQRTCKLMGSCCSNKDGRTRKANKCLWCESSGNCLHKHWTACESSIFVLFFNFNFQCFFLFICQQSTFWVLHAITHTRTLALTVSPVIVLTKQN